MSSTPALDAPITAMMQPEEIDYYREHLVRSTGGLIEFGGGGSTLMAIASPAPFIRSVESDSAWVAKLKQITEVARAEQSGRLQFHGDIGKTRRLGFPRSILSAWRWPNYYLRVWDTVDPGEVDTIFIDGRFRLACGLIALLKCRPEATILIHDFWDRPHYQHILHFTEELARAGSLTVLRRKSSLDRPRLKRLLATAVLDAR